jgi:hypothetical protein
MFRTVGVLLPASHQKGDVHGGSHGDVLYFEDLSVGMRFVAATRDPCRLTCHLIATAPIGAGNQVDNMPGVGQLLKLPS